LAAGWLKNAVINSATPKVSIIHRLKQNVGGFHPARDPKVVHASDVTKPGFCPRKWALRDLQGIKPKDEYVATAMEATFDVGNAVADLVTHLWLGQYAIGHWHCKTCHSQRSFTSRPGDGCKNMKACNWHYREVNFPAPTYGVSGSIDVFVDLGTLKYQATELKIIKAEDFGDIKQPLAEHVLRTQMYLKLISDSDSVYKDKINLHEARVLYTSRGYGKKNDDHNEILPWKEYVVERNDARVMPFLNMARQIKIFRETGAMPSGICTLPTDKHAKTCHQCKDCFSGTHPAAQPALEA
jgi:hypothetical protein